MQVQSGDTIVLTDKLERPAQSFCQRREGSIPRVASLSNDMEHVLAEHARREDREAQSIETSVGVLRELGWLDHAVPHSSGGSNLGFGGRDGAHSVRRLMELAGANLPLARLFEGHVNAHWLIHAYGHRELQDRAAELTHTGELLGVWGADGAQPVAWNESTGRLAGEKRFASGLGTVSHAVVTARAETGVQLYFVDVSDSMRADHGDWNMVGMRATASGTFDFDDLAPESFRELGVPGDYDREPGLVTGVWRIAALQLGATFSLLEAVRSELRLRDRLDSDAQVIRLAASLYRAQACIDLVTRAAEFCDSKSARDEPERAVALSLYARLMSADLAQTALVAAECSLGLSHFAERSDSGRIARDLSTYIRQISPDAFIQRSCRYVLESPCKLARFFEREAEAK